MNVQQPLDDNNNKSISLIKRPYSWPWWTEFDLLSPFKAVLKHAPLLLECTSRTEPWLVSRRRSIIEDLPDEILVEIFARMGWRDILSSQQTCKRLFEISTARALWVSLFGRLSFESMHPPLLERPITTYTAEQLRTVVLKYISSEVNFATHLPPRTRTLPTERFRINENDFILLEGGRWLLLSSLPMGPGRVFAYDLDKPLSQEPQCIIDCGVHDSTVPWSLEADLDRNEPSLTYNLCFMPFGTLQNGYDEAGVEDEVQIPNAPVALTDTYVYRVTPKGQGSDAMLEAHKIRTIHGTWGVTYLSIGLRGHYLARLVKYRPSGTYCIEICNWFLSDSCSHLKSYIFSENAEDIYDLLPLPDGRLLTVSTSSAALYDITDLHSLPCGKVDKNKATLQPYWRSKFEFSRVHVSKLYFDPRTDTMRVAIAAKGNLYGLVIPRENIAPSLQRICRSDLAASPKGFLGIDKTCDLEQQPIIKTSTFVWPDQEHHVGSTLLPLIPRSSEYTNQTDTKCIFPPLFDERSNRAFILGFCVWTVVDYAAYPPD
ncbi:hypothetical protein BDN70DRAFT_918943 [Pholiota conissans]|uniref:F-box domain-containing protein n=1 Tax=Pholiota conissans TaxID=109636 RepID=A0A9P5ZA38_9AGAR|nr:hypothetical protein BDN70DRAFT_918943 [Pholiota conissans]